MDELLNIFSLHGTYYNNDENRFTANILFLLSESRHRFLKELLHCLQIDLSPSELREMAITFQPCFTLDSGPCRPDAELKLRDKVHIVLEAKVGIGSLSETQLTTYAQILKASKSKTKRLCCVTQINHSNGFRAILKAIEPDILPTGTCSYLQWWQVLDLMKRSMLPSWNCDRISDRKLLSGQRQDYEERIATLFLREVENTMYDKKIIAHMPSGKLDDVVVQTQEPWFMEVAKRYCVWFPSGALEYGQRPSRYVAYYETDREGNQCRKQIAYLAKIKTIWNRITLGDARELEEFHDFFEDESVKAEMSTWGFTDTKTFHIAITEPPIKLRRPIPLGKRNLARVLSKRRYSLVDFLNADTIDDLFSEKAV